MLIQKNLKARIDSCKNILHIDDDPDDHEIFYCALKEVSNAICYKAFTNAQEALDKLAKNELTPDVIFLDLNMPGMNGQQFLVEIKKHEKLCMIPVIVLSTTSHTFTIKSVKDLGAHDFITKPGDFYEFSRILSSLLPCLNIE